MKIAITATGRSLDAEVDPRFGRCTTFVLVDTDSEGFEVLDNSSAALAGGAGIQTAQMLAQRGVDSVLTGHCGPNAHQTLSAAGIDVYVGCQGSIADALAAFRGGELTPASGPNVASHAGMGRGGRQA